MSGNFKQASQQFPSLAAREEILQVAPAADLAELM